MRFAVLGPMQVRDGDRRLEIGSGRERFVLATLLLGADRLVPTDRLIDALWTVPPATARAQLHNIIGRVRQRLRGACDAELIATRPLGYEFRLGEHELDVVRFRQLVERGRQHTADGDYAESTQVLADALALWQGTPLADIPDSLADGLRQPLHAERVAAAEALLDAQIATQRYEDALSLVTELTADHPHREGLVEAQMSCLSALGRRADALDCYRTAYRRLVDDLGIEPGAGLRDLHQQILDGRALRQRRHPVAAVVPRQLPPVTSTLAGRSKLVGRIRDDLRRAADGDGSVVVVVGPGGIGKSTTGLAAAHAGSDAFPDGQLFADLRGSHGEAADPHTVLGRLLRALGVESGRIPDDSDERVALYRTQLAEKRLLLVLDDAAGESQVRPLLPGSHTCAVLVTTRGQLGGLVDATRYSLPTLSPADAAELLTQIVGAERAAGEQDAIDGIVRLCGGLPLAVCVAGARLAVHPDWRVAEFERRLTGERRRLDELSVGDLDVRASIGLSYQTLSDDARRLLRRLGLVSAPDWPVWVAADLLDDATPDEVERILDELGDVHLVESLGADLVGQRRYRLHDLVAEFAGEQAHQAEVGSDRKDAVRRLVDGWLALASEADQAFSQGALLTMGLEVPAVDAERARPLRQSPRDWLEAERPSLVVAVDEACRIQDGDRAGTLALRLSTFLAHRTYWDDWERVLVHATDCVRAHGPETLLIRLLDGLRLVARQRVQDERVAELAAEGLELARRRGDDVFRIAAMIDAGWSERRLGRLTTSRAWLEGAIDACDSTTPPRLVSRANTALGLTHREAGQYERATPYAKQALEIERPLGNRRIIAICLQNYGLALLDCDDVAAAKTQLAEALTIAEDLADEHTVNLLIRALGDVAARAGRWQSASRLLGRSLRFSQAHEDRDNVAETLQVMGHLAAARGRTEAARDLLAQALRIRRELGHQVEVARLLARLEWVQRSAGDERGADASRTEWRAILERLGLDDACLRLPPGVATNLEGFG